ncbi:hypothetical protein HMPREF1979_00134 [Actinomyces johnsonii F0542]|uniref:Uncharacterized protein n=1 Tax=Actinomyces johnsonii F0542 TaxID=1321818 RepID=U1QDL5_9ACTO|nr:hypothetical protein HMPREF1979_00134 [Actinomyces johnsonii F0542]
MNPSSDCSSSWFLPTRSSEEGRARNPLPVTDSPCTSSGLSLP